MLAMSRTTAAALGFLAIAAATLSAQQWDHGAGALVAAIVLLALRAGVWLCTAASRFLNRTRK